MEGGEEFLSLMTSLIHAEQLRTWESEHLSAVSYEGLIGMNF